MSDVKHTPGPWHAQMMPCQTSDHTYSHQVVSEVSDGMNREVASLLTPGNARLIAAAPELLVACKLALPELVNEEAANAVRAAIAAAEGRS